MTSLIILILAVAVVAAATAFTTQSSLVKAFTLYLLLAGGSLAIDHWGITPLYNMVNVDGTFKPSILEAAKSTLIRWEEEEEELDAYNTKQDKLRGECMAIWDRPVSETGQRFSLKWLHEHCNSKYPSAWSIEDTK